MTAFGCGESADPVTPAQTVGSVLIGTVVSGNGRPMADAVVTSEPASSTSRTDAEGRFVLTGLGRNTYRVMVTKEEASTSVSYSIGKDTTEVTILLPRWKMIWSDEFDGAAQRSENWVNLDGSSGVTGEDIYYDSNRVSVADGRMRIEIIRQPSPTPWHGIKNYRGASMHTRRSFQQGRFAVRARLPRGRGIWPAIWLWPFNSFRRPEFDIMENLGHDPTVVYMTYHYDSAGVDRSRHMPFKGPDFSQEYHEFALEWFSSECRWYIDGVERFRSPIIGEVRPLRLTITSNVGGNWPGYPDSTTVFPQFYDIDYARVYEAVE
jgi:beta-glucanase (GH16 family)